jgi:hypothetical protein
MYSIGVETTPMYNGKTSTSYFVFSPLGDKVFIRLGDYMIWQAHKQGYEVWPAVAFAQSFDIVSE